ncbi:MAG: hypothetical protein ABIA21_00745 [Candidatus Aenigmatarchaeota archaeon]
MVIGTTELLRLVKEKNLVENLSQRELENPEGTGFDLRVGSIFSMKDGHSLLGESERYTVETDEVARYDINKKTIFELKPGQFVLVKTVEKVNLPDNIAIIFRPRSTLYRSGVSLHTATASPGYSGELIFGMHNMSSNSLKLELGARIVHALFLKVEGDIQSAYRGQWQGGRVSTQGEKETQV